MKITFPQKILISCLIVDFVVILLHLSLGSNYEVFNLDWERNLPTIYQSLKLILAGSTFLSSMYLIKLTKEQSPKLLHFLITLGSGLILMGVDEAAEIHESIPFYIQQFQAGPMTVYENFFRTLGYQSSAWILYIIPFIPPLLIIATYLTPYAISYYKKRFLLLVSAFGIFFLGAIGLEFIGTLDEVFFSTNYGVVMVIEELLEMIGGTMILWFAFEELQASSDVIINKLKLKSK